MPGHKWVPGSQSCIKPFESRHCTCCVFECSWFSAAQFALNSLPLNLQKLVSSVYCKKQCSDMSNWILHCSALTVYVCDCGQLSGSIIQLTCLSVVLRSLLSNKTHGLPEVGRCCVQSQKTWCDPFYTWQKVVHR